MRNNLIQGTTYIGIHIDNDGNLGDGFTIHQSLGSDADAQLKSLFDGLMEKGQWKPRVVVHDLNKRVEIETSLLIPIAFRLQDEKNEPIDFKRSTFEIPDRYDLIYDEIVIIGFGDSQNKNSPTKN